MQAAEAAEAAARDGYGRLLATLVARTRDVAAAEDALAEAFGAALASWPARGVPARPEAWLLTAARRTLGHGHRHARVRSEAASTLLALAEEAEEAMPASFPDRRLELLFVCAHPGIDPAARAPLMLQTVLGLDAARIAAAFLTAPAAMSQRLVRAKARIRDAGIAFALPEQADLPGRLADVLDAVYAAYGSGWDDVAGGDPRRRGLTEEAIWLGSLLASLLPGEPEAHGLLALMLHCEARRPARRDPSGAYVPLEAQDPALWSRPAIEQAEAALRAAAGLNRPGRYQLEAAIQSAHVARRVAGAAPWSAIAALYEALVAVGPSMGALVGRAAALAEAAGPQAALAALSALPAEAEAYQPAWALRANLHLRLGEARAAAAAYDRAAALAEDPAVRRWLTTKASALQDGGPE